MGSALQGGRITTGAPSRPMELKVPSWHASPPSPSGGSTPKQRVTPAPSIEALEGGSLLVITWSDPSQEEARAALKHAAVDLFDWGSLLSENQRIEIDNVLYDLCNTLALLAMHYSHYYLTVPLPLCDGNNTSIDAPLLLDAACVVMAALDVGMVDMDEGHSTGASCWACGSGLLTPSWLQ